MASINELYIQLGFEPADAHWKVPHPATHATCVRHKYQRLEDSSLKRLRSHSMLLELLQGVREYAERFATASVKLEVYYAAAKSTPIRQVSLITKDFLELDEKGLRISELLAEIFSFVIRSSKIPGDERANRSSQAQINNLPVPPDSARAGTSDRPTFFVDLEGNDDSDVDVGVEHQEETESDSLRSPLTFCSTDELAKELRAWRQAHGNAQVPGTAFLDPNGFHAKRVMTDEGQAEVVRFKIDNDFMGWVLNKKDGTRVFVQLRNGGQPSGSVRYYGWLGENRGFAKEPIATSWAAPSSLLSLRRSRDLNVSENFRREMNSQSERVVPNEKLEVLKSQERPYTAISDELHEGPSKLYKPLSEEKSREAPFAWPEWLKARPESNNRKAAMNILMQASRVHHPGKQSCDKCLDAGVECITASSYKRCARCTAYNLHGCSAVSQAVARKNSLPQSLQDSQSDVMDEPTSCSVAARMSTRSSGRTDPPPSLSPLGPSTPEVSFSFFSSDPSLGAMTKPASVCNTLESFFDTALSAWNITGSQTSECVVAVKVSWAGAKWPLMIP